MPQPITCNVYCLLVTVFLLSTYQQAAGQAADHATAAAVVDDLDTATSECLLTWAWHQYLPFLSRKGSTQLVLQPHALSSSHHASPSWSFNRMPCQAVTMQQKPGADSPPCCRHWCTIDFFSLQRCGRWQRPSCSVHQRPSCSSGLCRSRFRYALDD